MKTVDAGAKAQLRQDAETKLRGGDAPKHDGVAGMDALTLLHRFASDPATASDALKLLHELQVYQVEVDLQLEQHQQNEREFSDALLRYSMFYNSAPIAQFAVDDGGTILEGNDAGAELLGVDRDELGGRSLGGCLSPAGWQALQAVLRRLRNTGAEIDLGGMRNVKFHGKEICMVGWAGGAGAHAVRIDAKLAPDGRSFLLACLEMPDLTQRD